MDDGVVGWALCAAPHSGMARARPRHDGGEAEARRQRPAWNDSGVAVERPGHGGDAAERQGRGRGTAEARRSDEGRGGWSSGA